MDIVTLIVPIYNTEKYLRECIDSILSQTYAGLEIILVDDGSTDGSGRICDEYLKTDSRVRVIHQANGGLSAARNEGMDRASGDYLAFIDSDDHLRNDYVEKLLEAVKSIKADNDRICFSFCDCETGRCTIEISGLRDKTIISRYDYIKNISDPISRDYLLGVMACNKMYPRKDLDQIRFPRGRIHEDEFFINKILQNMENCAFVPEKLYIYRDNEEGITGTKHRFDLRHLDVLDAYSERVAITYEMGNKTAAEITARNGLYKLCRMYLEAQEDPDNFEVNKKEIRKKYREFFHCNNKYMNIKKRAKYALFLISPIFSKLICR